MLIKRKIASILLKLFATCDLVFALESRTDVCDTRYIRPDGHFRIDNNYADMIKEPIIGDGPAVILVVID